VGSDEIRLVRYKTKMQLKKLHHSQIYLKHRQRLAAKEVGKATKKLDAYHVMVRGSLLDANGSVKFFPASHVSSYQKAQRKLVRATRLVLSQRATINLLKKFLEDNK